MAKSSSLGLADRRRIADQFSELLGLDEDAVSHVASEESGRPSCLIVHPNFGILAIEVGGRGEGAADTRKRLNQKVESLRRQLNPLTDLVIQNIVVSLDTKSEFEEISKTSFVVTKGKLAYVDWNSTLKKANIKPSQITELRNRLWPSMAFKVDTYEGTTDGGKEEREFARAILDANQAKIALQDVEGAMVISGPPGSGKSLVLAARAKHLASLHPEWKIVLVVYNKMLAKHFLATADSWPKNIEVVTLKNLLEKRGEKVLAKLTSEYNNHEEAMRDAQKIIAKLKNDKEIKADIDALLVDEWQDFAEPYISYLLDCVRAERGGAVFAGDKGQAIYTDGLPNTGLRGIPVKKVELRVPYRSTKQILDVAQALDKEYQIAGTEQASNGEPVSLIFATTWQLQAEAIAWEIKSLVESGERTIGEIVVLCTTRNGATTVERVLNDNKISNAVHTRFWDEVDLSHDKVNVMTVHGGKGFGFKVVFVMGFDTLRDLDGTAERDRWGRVGYVAVTRAEDLLFILYKTETQFMRNLKKCKKGTLVSRSYPDDYKRTKK